MLLGGIIVVKINGEAINAEGKTISEYLSGTKYECCRIAVERNGNIVPKKSYEETVLRDGDCLEIVQFVGGG